MQRADLAFERERVELLLARRARRATTRRIERLGAARRATRDATSQRYLDAIVKANEPTVAARGQLRRAAPRSTGRRYVDFDGVERPLLADDELQYLMIRKGNLDERERREIESHVTHTYRFLEQIPWTRELRGIPEIAYGHHEKLNGRGYPRAVSAEAIPVQTRMMTIADIFDALTATDRPYKRAVPLERALDILRDGSDRRHARRASAQELHRRSRVRGSGGIAPRRLVSGAMRLLSARRPRRHDHARQLDRRTDAPARPRGVARLDRDERRRA